MRFRNSVTYLGLRSRSALATITLAITKGAEKAHRRPFCQANPAQSRNCTPTEASAIPQARVLANRAKYIGNKTQGQGQFAPLYIRVASIHGLRSPFPWFEPSLPHERRPEQPGKTGLHPTGAPKSTETSAFPAELWNHTRQTPVDRRSIDPPTVQSRPLPGNCQLHW